MQGVTEIGASVWRHFSTTTRLWQTHCLFSWTDIATNVTFWVWVDYVMYYPANDKLLLKGTWPRPRHQLLNFGTPSSASYFWNGCSYWLEIWYVDEAHEALACERQNTLKEIVVGLHPGKGCGILGHLPSLWRGWSWLANEKWQSKGAWPGSPDRLWNFGTPFYLWNVNAADLKFYTVCRWSRWGTSLWTKGRRRAPERISIFCTPSQSVERMKLGFYNLVCGCIACGTTLQMTNYPQTMARVRGWF